MSGALALRDCWLGAVFLSLRVLFWMVYLVLLARVRGGTSFQGFWR
jgi:hypothetical protein